MLTDEPGSPRCRHQAGAGVLSGTAADSVAFIIRTASYVHDMLTIGNEHGQLVAQYVDTDDL